MDTANNSRINSPVISFSHVGLVTPARYATLAAVTMLAAMGSVGIAHSQGFSYNGNRYSTGTTSSTTYASFDNATNSTILQTTLTQTSAQGTRTLTNAPSEYFGYNVAAATGTNDGRRVDNAAPYPDGYEFGGNLVQTGTGAGGTVNATFHGNSVGSSAQAFSSNTWIKGDTESGGAWNVLAGRASMLGGYTNATMVGSVTMDLSAVYTSFGALIGTNAGASLNVTITGFNTTSATPNTPLFTYGVNGITHNTANPNFTGYASTKGFNRVVITGLQNSTTAGNSTYTVYPNAAFIALDQVEFGQTVPGFVVPESGSATLLGVGGIVCLGLLRFPRKRRRSNA